MAGDPTKLSIGIGDLQINGTTVGFLKNSVKSIVDKHVVDFEAPTPGQGPTLFLQDSTTIRENFTIQAGLAQLTAASFSAAIGGDAIVNTPGSSTPVTGEYILLIPNFVGGLYGASFDGPTVSAVTLALGNVTLNNPNDFTFVAGTGDQGNFNQGNGYFVANPSSSNIAAGGNITCTYTYVPTSLATVALGVTFTLANVMIDFIHQRKNGKYVYLKMWKARARGRFELTFNEDVYNINQIEFSTIPDFDNHPTQPLGYFAEQV